MSFDLPYWVYSPRSKKGRRWLGVREKKRNQVLDLWLADLKTIEIAVTLGISETTVKRYIRQARAAGDLRALKREQSTKEAMRRSSLKKTIRIRTLNKQKLPVREIAKLVGCSRELVYMRLREAGEEPYGTRGHLELVEADR